MTPTILNIGCGLRLMPKTINLDGAWNARADVHADLERCADIPLPFSDNTFSEMFLIHTIEHIHNVLPLMQELHRVAMPNASLHIRCPHGASDDADEDPTHVRRMFPRSFTGFSQPYYYKADYGYRGDWLCETVTLLIHNERVEPSVAAIHKALLTERNVVLEMVTTMTAIKPARAVDAQWKWPKLEIEIV